ncbi:MAG: 5-formyltetrahydrofolate cyclo-ligase [Rickettsiales bacterium]|nr:5-formyltetrahydrofolate cyclo-ligase [Rickettsiales bacterium]
MTSSKDRIRKEMLHRRVEMSDSDRLSASQSVTLHFMDHPYMGMAMSMAGYYPYRNELDILPIFNRMDQYHKQCALPVTQEDGSMTFCAWQPGNPLTEDAYGIRIPESQTPMMPEVVLVPLLAFNQEGYRIGYGGGYYDRIMENYREIYPQTLFFGVAYDFQESDEIEPEAHDQILDGILTPSGVGMFRTV